MQSIKISHESPIALFEQAKNYNDYDYCLVHLMEKCDAYRDYYLYARNLYNREVLLDCSIFELKKAFNSKKYAQWVESIQPNSYIIPDVLEEKDATIESFKKYQAQYGNLSKNNDALTIGAVQGKTWQELKDCYKFMRDNADIIAISFDLSYFEITGEGVSWENKMMTGRQRFIDQLISSKTWDANKPHHLLGASLPQEFAFYRQNEIKGIRSIDTSNPVVHGMKNIKYNSTFGLKKKLRGTLLADLIEATIDRDQWLTIEYNITQFRQIVNG